MMNRRDILLGAALLFVVAGLVFMALVVLVSVGGEGFGTLEKSVALINIQGAIYDPMPVVEQLERYLRDDNITAIVLRLNTPGGGISATQEIYETVYKARDAGKMVVASMGTVAASGGYYIAAACDTIMATPGTITGSIGVIASFSEISELLEKIGVKTNTRISGKYKDTGTITREMRDDEKALLDEVIMDSYEQFLEAVCEGRDLDEDYVREYADGRVFTGRMALDYGFVDALGTYQDAIDLAGDMTGLGIDPPIVQEKDDLFWEMLMEGTSKAVTRGIERTIPRISYMWLQ